MILLVLLFLFVSAYAKQCFLSCGDFDDCDSARCANQCSDEERFSRIAFTVEECRFEDDLCVFREFIFKRSPNDPESEEFSTEIPGGCLLNYQHTISNEQRFRFAEGTNLFTCGGNMCNVPPLDTCTQEAALARSQGEDVDDLCAIIKAKDSLNGLMTAVD